MSYLVLARKYRPQTFASVSGQEHVTGSLTNAILQDRVPHALIFSGPRGVGKTTIARVLAKSLNCLQRQDVKKNESKENAKETSLVEPCGECSNCLEITKGSSFAVLEIDGASNNSVENVRSLIDSLYTLAPPGYPYKVYIIDEVHMLSVSAFNALLKSLEEPPPNTIFIFATTEPQKIPDTVVSRCQRYDFQRLGMSDICIQLEEIVSKEKVKISKEVLRFIALRSQGGMRDAQSLLDRIITLSNSSSEITMEQIALYFGAVSKNFFNQLSKAVLESDSKTCLVLLDQAFSHSLDIKAFADDLVSHFRSLLIVSVMIAKSGQSFSYDNLSSEEKELLEEYSPEELEELSLLAQTSEVNDVQRLFFDVISISESAVKSTYPRYLFEAGIVKMALLPSLQPVAELLSYGFKSGGEVSQKLIANSFAPVSPAAYSKVSPKAHSSATPQVKGTLISSSSLEGSDTSKKKDLISDQTISEPAAGKPEFKPNWQDFVDNVKNNSGPVLSAYLRRVSPALFEAGTLKLKASSFDAKALEEKDMNAQLRSFLKSYSGIDIWNIEIQAIDDLNLKASSSSIKGSIAVNEASKNKSDKVKILKEAKEQEAVKEVLKAFEGSSIDGVKPLVKI